MIIPKKILCSLFFLSELRDMEIYQDINRFHAHNPVVTIGTFDGVHLGHQKVIQRLKEFSQKYDGESVIFTFYPHPRLITAPDEGNLRLLTTLEEKKMLFEKSGIDHLIVYPFTKAFSELSYSRFVKEILVDKIKTRCLVVGYDHRFGKNREGGYEYLKECARLYHFKVEKLEALLMDELHISSTKIRNYLQKGNILKANKYLGYRYTLHGKVIAGNRVGRLIGFPTANIQASDVHKLIPGYGVYAVDILLEGRTYRGMLNIGSRPTFNNNADNRSIEVHIFRFSGDIYHKEIILEFADKIREERKFSGAGELTEQLKKDKEAAIRILSAG